MHNDVFTLCNEISFHTRDAFHFSKNKQWMKDENKQMYGDFKIIGER